MAVKVLTVANVVAWDDLVSIAPETATSATDGFEIEVDGDTMFFVQNSSGETAYDVTFKAGDGMQAMDDLTEEIAASGMMLVKISSGAFKNLSGTNKGKILVIPENVAILVKAIKF